MTSSEKRKRIVALARDLLVARQSNPEQPLGMNDAHFNVRVVFAQAKAFYEETERLENEDEDEDEDENNFDDAGDEDA